MSRLDSPQATESLFWKYEQFIQQYLLRTCETDPMFHPNSSAVQLGAGFRDSITNNISLPIHNAVCLLSVAKGTQRSQQMAVRKQRF